MKPTAAVDPEAWKQHAECRGLNPDMFLPTRGDNRALEAAKRVCNRCPVRTECLDYALKMNERTGVWGGVSERQRREMRRKLNPAGPTITHRIVTELNPDRVYTAAEVQRALNLRSHSGVVPALQRAVEAGQVELVRPFQGSQRPSLYKLCGGSPRD